MFEKVQEVVNLLETSSSRPKLKRYWNTAEPEIAKWTKSTIAILKTELFIKDGRWRTEQCGWFWI